MMRQRLAVRAECVIAVLASLPMMMSTWPAARALRRMVEALSISAPLFGRRARACLLQCGCVVRAWISSSLGRASRLAQSAAAVECIDSGTDCLEIEEAAAHLRKVGQRSGPAAGPSGDVIPVNTAGRQRPHERPPRSRTFSQVKPPANRHADRNAHGQCGKKAGPSPGTSPANRAAPSPARSNTDT